MGNPPTFALEIKKRKKDDQTTSDTSIEANSEPISLTVEPESMETVGLFTTNDDDSDPFRDDFTEGEVEDEFYTGEP